MLLSNTRRILLTTIAVAAAACVAAPRRLAAASPDTGENITFTATGTFAASAVSGDDQFKLAGQPFTIKVVTNSAASPAKHGPNWAAYDNLEMTGTIFSGLLPPNSPVNIKSLKAVITLTVGSTQDIVQVAFPVRVIGIGLEVSARIVLPGGTLSNDRIHPFASAALDAANTAVTYKNSTAATVLAVATGTLVGKAPAGGAE
jgi:hypothetical protein